MALKVWLPLNGTLDNQGLSTLVSSGTPTFLNNGKMGKCISLTPRVSFTGLPKLEKFTILFWLKVDSCSSDWADSLSFTSKQADGSSAAPFRFEATKTTRACSFHNNIPYAITTGSRILITEEQKGEWHHCGFSYDGEHCYTYIDGVLTYTDTGLGGYLIDYFHIGETNNMVGGMNDLRIYDEVLSDKQIKEIAKGLCVHYKLEGVGANKNLLTNSYVENRNHSSTSYPCAAYPLGTSVIANKKYTVSVNATFTDAYVIALYFGGGSYGTQWVDCSQNGTYTLSWTFTANSNMAAQNFVNVYVRDADNTPKIGIAKCIVHWVKLEEGEIVTPWIPNEADALYTKLGYDKALTTDVSGFGYNGTITGELTFDSDSPRYAGSTKFNGSSYITTTPGSLAWCNFDNLTISAWMKPTVKPGGWTGSIGIQQDGGTTKGKIFSISNYAGNFSVHTDNGSGWVTTQSEALPLNQWSHCVATLTDRTNLKMYINGKLVKTATINYNTATVLSDTRIAIGVDLPGDDEKYTGSYSDVRFYSTALSAEDILKLYEISGIIDNKGNTYSYEFIEED